MSLQDPIIPYKQKILKTGNSLGVSIPADFARHFGLKPGQQVLALENYETSSITYTFTTAAQLPLLEKAKKEVAKTIGSIE